MQASTQVLEAAEATRERLKPQTQFAVILGSGLGGLADRMTEQHACSFRDLPHVSQSTATGHRGRFVYGKLDGLPLIALDGRLHRYEGWQNSQIVFPIHVLAALGITTLIVSNAAGGLSYHYRIGDIVVIADHIHLQFGRSDSRFAPAPSGSDTACLPSVLGRSSNPYDPALIEVALATARKYGFNVYPGVYASTIGPNYETRAEYRMFRRFGADVVGMSTIPEVLAAQSLGMRILAMSMVSNVARPDAPTIADHQEVLAAGAMTEAKMSTIVQEVLRYTVQNTVQSVSP